MANIPPELFQRIIENLCSAPELKKHDLGLCSLTCRYWAATIRPDIFRELTLRSRDDAIAFLQFIRPESTTTVASFGAYVQKLSLEQLIRPHGVPWMHLVALASGGGPPLLPKLSKVVVMLMGGDRTQSAFPTSIYADIPRSIPPSAIHPSELLLITGRFRRFEDILALSRSAPSSASMDFQSLSWDDVDRLTASSALTTRAMLWNRAPHSSSRTIRLRNCTAMWPLIWLTLGRPPPPLSPMGSSPRAPPLHRATSLIYVHPEELGRIARLVQAMQEACACLPVVAPNETERVKPCAEYEICSRTEGEYGGCRALFHVHIFLLSQAPWATSISTPRTARAHHTNAASPSRLRPGL